MDDSVHLRVIARLKSDFTTKFGIPRQSGLVEAQRGDIVFEPEFRDANALRGLEGYSHIWLLWGFTNPEKGSAGAFSPMVKPPRLGGKKRVGVFASRSPFRPNPLGLSSVRLLGMEAMPGRGTVLHVSGADLMHDTPIYDIKPYLAYTDSHPDALAGFAGERFGHALKVEFDEELLALIPEDKREALTASLAQDPRPGYQDDPESLYGFEYAGFDVRFSVCDDVLSVREVERLKY